MNAQAKLDRTPPAIVALILVALAGMAFSLHGCASSPTDPTAIASPSPQPSTEPTPAPVDTHLDINVRDDASRTIIQEASPGQTVRFQSSITCSDPDTRKSADCPFVEEWHWENLSDPATQCGYFGELTSDHPKGDCAGVGEFMARVTAVGFDGKTIGISPIFKLRVR